MVSSKPATTAVTEHDRALFSDLTLCFSGRELQTHKAILYHASEWFRNAFTSDFSEASTRSIVLHDDNADALQTVVDLCYRNSIAERRAHLCDLKQTKTVLTDGIETYIVADKYGFQSILQDLHAIISELIKTCYQRALVGWRLDDGILDGLEACYAMPLPCLDPFRTALTEAVHMLLPKLIGPGPSSGEAHREEARDALFDFVAKHGALGHALYKTLSFVPAVTYYDYECRSCELEIQLMNYVIGVGEQPDMTISCDKCGVDMEIVGQRRDVPATVRVRVDEIPQWAK